MPTQKIRITFRPTASCRREGLIDEFIAYPTNLGTVAATAARAKLAAQLLSKEFDAVVYLMPRARSLEQIDRDERFFRLCRDQIRFLERTISDKRGLTRQFQFRRRRSSQRRDTCWQCLSADGLVASSQCKTDLLLTTAETEAARKWFRDTTGRSPEELKLDRVSRREANGNQRSGPRSGLPTFSDRLVTEFDVFPVDFRRGRRP